MCAQPSVQARNPNASATTPKSKLLKLVMPAASMRSRAEAAELAVELGFAVLVGEATCDRVVWFVMLATDVAVAFAVRGLLEFVGIWEAMEREVESLVPVVVGAFSPPLEAISEPPSILMDWYEPDLSP